MNNLESIQIGAFDAGKQLTIEQIDQIIPALTTALTYSETLAPAAAVFNRAILTAQIKGFALARAHLVLLDAQRRHEIAKREWSAPRAREVEIERDQAAIALGKLVREHPYSLLETLLHG